MERTVERKVNSAMGWQTGPDGKVCTLHVGFLSWSPHFQKLSNFRTGCPTVAHGSRAMDRLSTDIYRLLLRR
eukprot:6282247-Amphidinium_carterae.1